MNGGVKVVLGWGVGEGAVWRSSFIKSLREVAPVVFQPVHQWGEDGERFPEEDWGSLVSPPALPPQ